MPVPFSSEDLGRVFDARTLTQGRTLVLTDHVEIALEGDAVSGSVRDGKLQHAVHLTPSLNGSRLAFISRCGCGRSSCAHLAATALAALDRFPALRKIKQQSFLDTMLSSPKPELRQLFFHLGPGKDGFACFVTCMLEGTGVSRLQGTTPRQVLLAADSSDEAKALARMLGSGEVSRVGVKSGSVPAVLGMLIETGQAKWAPSGKRLTRGEERVFASASTPNLPLNSAIILADGGSWYVDSITGEAGRVSIRPSAAKAPKRAAARTRSQPRPLVPRRPVPAAAAERVIIERPMVPLLHLTQLDCPDDYGRVQRLDALMLDFDYGGVRTHADDERQFLKADDLGDSLFIRRDPQGEAAALEKLRQDGFIQMRIPDGRNARGRRVFTYRGRDSSEAWQRFIMTRLPDFESSGWQSRIEGDFGPKLVETIGDYDVKIRDAEDGHFSIDLGIEIAGKRQSLLPILNQVQSRGGVQGSNVVDGQLIASLQDGRILRLPADRIEKLLTILSDLLDVARPGRDDSLVLPQSEVPAVLELEEVVTARWENAAAIQAYLRQYSGAEEILPTTLPATFTAELRHYQQEGVDWLQHLRSHALAGILADDMGLGKTAQAIAHITIEKEAGRLDRPVLIVMPTSLVPNWTAELHKFAPSLTVIVLHGLDRHERRAQLSDFDIAITTYTVLARDIDTMREIPWHMVVLDEAQAIKSPDAKATRAVCQLDTRHKVCLSGTPIENNLGELWSEFAFLMPGLLGDQKGFTKRFRTPIERHGDNVRRTQLVQRIKPFILRRTKSEVATELPPKHVVLRRVELAPEQRALYETIRALLHEEVREQIAARSIGQSRIIVLDALLKLRQVCCDPRLVKSSIAREVLVSSKLDDLMEMVTEMISEGRRILLFSQFTSMLDLIKPRLAEANITHVELRGDTRDRAEPVRAFEAGEVPLFLISLKAGGKGLNLVSADTVIHYDPWWNPAVEDQASDRAHRIGQTKSVFVYKLLAAGTVEEKIVELQQRKAALAGIALGDTEELPAFGLDDIDYLFGPAAEEDEDLEVVSKAG